MRVLVVSHSCIVDVNQQLFITLNSREDVDVALLLPANWKSEFTGEAISPRLLAEVTFPVFQEQVTGPGNISLHFYRKLPLEKLRAFSPDVIFSTQEPWSLSNLQAMWIADRLKIPFVFQTNQNILKRYPLPFSFIESTAYRKTAIALAYSEEARQVMLTKGLNRPSVVVPYATDTRRFIPQDSTVLRKELGLTGAVVIGYMGRLVPEKGLDTLIDAFAAISKSVRTTSVKLLIVGTGEQKADLEKRIVGHGIERDVVFTGVVPHSEAARYMSCMDIFVLPSKTMPNWKEQFGRVIIEALACGIPVVGSDSGQIPHLIRETGGGCVFHEGDVEDLARTLTELLDSPQERKRLVTQGGHVVTERFTCEAVANQLYQIFHQVVGNRVAASPALAKGPASHS